MRLDRQRISQWVDAVNEAMSEEQNTSGNPESGSQSGQIIEGSGYGSDTDEQVASMNHPSSSSSDSNTKDVFPGAKGTWKAASHVGPDDSISVRADNDVFRYKIAAYAAKVRDSWL